MKKKNCLKFVLDVGLILILGLFDSSARNASNKSKQEVISSLFP